MIRSFRNFAKTKYAGLLVFIMIIPFVFWGMGSMFSSGNTNTIAKINKTNISTEDFIDHLNNSGIPQNTIRDNLKNNIIEELLSNLISTSLLNLEIENYNLIISQNTLLNRIKNNKNFIDENGKFQRIKYEKFLLENNQSAPQFEQRLKKRELQKNLFDYIGSGSVSPKFLVKKLFQEENKKIEIDYINLESFYKKKETFTEKELESFINDNQEQLKIEYFDFDYAVINPKNLIGIDDFNQSFFDKIDQIEANIANGLTFEMIINDIDVPSIKKTNFRYSKDINEVEKKIIESKNFDFDIFESGDDFILYNIKNISVRSPDIKDEQTKNEISNLLFQKNKFDYNRKLLEKINSNNFDNNDFLEMSKKNVKTVKLNSIKDNKKFEINSVEILYSMPKNSFTLINDSENNIFIAKIKEFDELTINNDDQLNDYINKQNSNIKNSMLEAYDLYLNKKYKVDLNQKTIERVKNFFQ